MKGKNAMKEKSDNISETIVELTSSKGERIQIIQNNQTNNIVVHRYNPETHEFEFKLHSVCSKPMNEEELEQLFFSTFERLMYINERRPVTDGL